MLRLYVSFRVFTPNPLSDFSDLITFPKVPRYHPYWRGQVLSEPTYTTFGLNLIELFVLV